MENREKRIPFIVRVKDDVPPAYPGGPSHKAGSALCLTTLTRDSKGNIIDFLTPCPIALALSIAIQASKRAIELHQTIDFRDVVTPYGPAKTATKISSLFDYFECCMVAVTFSFQALEVFCNDIIGKKLKGTYKLQRKKNVIEVSVYELQRLPSTEEKLATILPDILKVNSPKSGKVWENFKELKKIRDTTIHLKSHDLYKSDIDEESFFYEFFRIEADKFPRFALEMIEFFTDSKEAWPWLELYHKQIFNTID